MAKIDIKIIAFVGTEASSRLVDSIAVYTDGIYAAVSSRYGDAPLPGGNITLIQKYLDEEGLRKWIRNTGASLVIDGTAVSAADAGSMIRSVCEDLHLEYVRIVEERKIKSDTEICRDPSSLLRTIQYSVQNVLVEAEEDIFRILTEDPDYRKKIIPLLPPDSGLLQKLNDMGYPPEHIICTGRVLSAPFLQALFAEYNVTHYIFRGDVLSGLSERLDALNHSMVHATILGDPAEEKGRTAEQYLREFEKRFGITWY